MNRPTAVFLCFALFTLVVVVSLSAQVRGDFELAISWVHFISIFALAMGLLFYCGFAAVHAVQRIECPRERASWLIVTLGLNALGSCFYYCTKYQTFRKQGLGWLITSRNVGNSDMNIKEATKQTTTRQE